MCGGRVVKDLTPSQRGAVAEAAIRLAAIELGLVVLLPASEGGRYDLAIDLEPRLLRVQCKLAQHLAGVLHVRVSTSRYTPRGYVRTSYSAEEIDAIGAYSPELRRCFLVPIDEVPNRNAMHLRLDPTKNNQADRIKWARDYEFDAIIARLQGSQLESSRAR